MDKKVLVVEDEPDIREAIAEAIAQTNISVSTAENGQVGLKKALEEEPDLILLDIVMPIMDGHGMLAKLREDAWGKKANVIMLTSMDDVKSIGQAHEGNIEDYIIKAHSSLDEIVTRVKVALLSK